ncbi:PilZ domain-containing protein [Marinicauda salina]|uniref:PilZ domain-containing protein n=1 Tax=Marinicauda salina TaxID=2135793 RepID=A0A2U2BU01_9PROT|nr:PilZ domain-containing protein [Marinicauda salina]PWE17472.1 PilZ domain-containing protein [Marinicauda salina]
MDSYAEASRKSKNRRKLDRRQIRIAARGAQERRRFRRVELSMPGRYLDRVRGEFPCTLVDISPGGARVAAEVPPALHDRIVMLFDGLGRMEGEVVRAGKAGFIVRLIASERKRDRLADAITWRYNMQRLGLDEDRGAPRRAGRGRARIRFADGVTIDADVVDISVTGAAFKCEERPRIGERVHVGDMVGRVARWLDTGFAVAFDPPSVEREARSA